MPIVKMQNRRIGCAIPHGIQWYIECKREGRCLVREFLNVRDRDQRDWARAFDRTRMAEGNHLPYHGKLAVQYVHAQIAPDPRDDVLPDEMAAFAKEWAAEWFGANLEPGRLGCFQVAIGVHDDSENGVMHAHLVVNNTDLLTGRRLQIGDRDNAAMKDRVQDLARERGWHYFDNTPDMRWMRAEKGLSYGARRAMLPSGTPPTMAERGMARRGKATWKGALRSKVSIAKEISTDEGEFRDACEALGVSVEETKDGDLVFSIEWDGARMAAVGGSLGQGWRGPGVEGRSTIAKGLPREEAAALRRNVLRALDAARGWEVSARGIREAEIASTLMTMHRWGIQSAGGFGAAVERSRERMYSTRGPENERARAEHAALLEARACAERMEILRGVSGLTGASEAASGSSGQLGSFGISGEGLGRGCDAPHRTPPSLGGDRGMRR